MLTKFHKILLGLLVVQLALALYVVLKDDEAVVVKETPLLAGFDTAKVTRLQVFGPDAQMKNSDGTVKKPIDLVKKGENWVLASHFDYPVVASKVTDVLTPIGKMAAAEPTATNKSRHKQLKVDDADFERKLVITADGKDTTVYIGGTAGARKTAVRLGSSANVYGVKDINAYSSGIEPRQWIETKYSEVPVAEIAKVTIARPAGSAGGTVELIKGPPPSQAGSGAGSGSGSGAGSAGSAAGSGSGAVVDVTTATIEGAPIKLEAGETIDAAAIERIMSDVATIDGTAPADPKRDASAPNATITIERKATATSVPPIVLDVIKDGESYWVKQRGTDKAVMVDKGRLQDVVGISRDKLVKKPEPPKDDKAGSAAAPPPGMPDMPPGIPPHMIPPTMPPGH